MTYQRKPAITRGPELFFQPGSNNCLWSLNALTEVTENALRGGEGRARASDSGCLEARGQRPGQQSSTAQNQQGLWVHKQTSHPEGLTPQAEGDSVNGFAWGPGSREGWRGSLWCRDRILGFWASPCKFLLLTLGFSMVPHGVCWEHQSLEDRDIIFIVE